MNNGYRYILETGSKKHLCPDCRKKSFVRYLDTETKQYLPDIYGRCDHESKCSYHLNPYKAGYGTNEPKEHEHRLKPKPQPRPVHYLPEAILTATLKDYEKNTFIQNLLKLAPVEDIERVISLYRIGTIGKGERAGAVTLPFIDKAGNIRTIQAKQFSETNHTQSTDFVHSIIARHHTNRGEAVPVWLQDYTKNEGFVSCLFGEHLLNKYPLNPVALVEAPKTAIIGTLYYGLPETPGALLWIAVYNKSSLTLDKCKALQGRKVVLFPDLNAFELWNTKAQELKAKLPGTRFVVSDLLEQNATESERTAGLDLADYLTRFDYRLFRKEPEPFTPEFKPLALINKPFTQTQEQSNPQASKSTHSEAIQEPEPIRDQLSEPITKSENSEKHENETKHYFEQKTTRSNPQPESWHKEIEILEAYFNDTPLPEGTFNLSQWETITDLPKFILSHLETLKRYNGNHTFKPHLQRLQRMKEYLNKNTN